MITIANQFGMKEALAQLGIKEINEGTSTGLNHFSNGAILESYSPVDGQLIAKVKTSQRQTTKSNGVRYRSFQNIQIDAGTTW
jgi:hypothetical protein